MLGNEKWMDVNVHNEKDVHNENWQESVTKRDPKLHAVWQSKLPKVLSISANLDTGACTLASAKLLFFGSAKLDTGVRGCAVRTIQGVHDAVDL